MATTSDDQLLNTGKEWLLHILMGCSDDVRDMVIMLVCRSWQLCTDQTHDEEVPPIDTTVEFLDNYHMPIKLARHFSSKEIIKGIKCQHLAR